MKTNINDNIFMPFCFVSGLTDNAEEGRFRWEDDGPLSYADWYIADR